ncbi:transcriptional regulator [Nitrosospira multiformis]|uniref:Transcriptional regulator, XRE family n=1 Tax=Nitrosospira multiformis TaxID=1231 RepID=A0A1I7I4M9_9PROT|nr:transcriptional regulator [Nitrosospira multiformis]SFU67878.1 transcriptional regulator, XRE family [Nitrosospira multiformis]
MTRHFIYHDIFFTNVLRVLDERKISQRELADRAGISTAFISDVTQGRSNPSLRTMEAISMALDIPLPTLLESTDLDRKTLDELAGGKAPQSLPVGYQRVCAVMTDYQAFLAMQWDEANRRKIKGHKAHKKRNKPNSL